MPFWSGIHGIVVARKMPHSDIQQGAQIFINTSKVFRYQTFMTAFEVV
jgi:hypothetical protein